MTAIDLITNPSSQDIARFHKLHRSVDPMVIKKISGDNIRVEINRHENYVFVVFHIPEYIMRSKTIDSVEINVFYDRSKNKATIFAFKTKHFFQKYRSQILGIKYTTFSKFLESLLNIILEDEAKIIEHILKDTRDVKEEYRMSQDSALLIRHLTNNLTNITTLKLICDNQDQLLNKAEEYIRNFENSTINYQRNYISEELLFAKNFCETLMNSINTKYQVRMTDIMYGYTRFTFVIFLAGAVFQITYSFIEDPSPIKLTFWLACLVTFLGTLVVFRKL